MADTPANETSPVSEPGDGAPHLVPAWLDNLAALGWRMLAIVAFAVVAWYLATLIWNVVASIGLAIIVAVVLAPFVLKLRDGGRSRTSAASIAWIIAISAALGLLLLLAVALLPYLVEVVERLSAGQSELEGRLADLQLPAWLNVLVLDVIAGVEEMGEDAITSIVGSLANAVGILILASFLLFFFLRDGDKAWLWLFQSLGDEKRERITTAGDDALERVGSYVRGTTAIAAIMAASSYVFMLILGVPLALPLAIMTFIAAYIPYFGTATAALIVVLITLGAVSSTAAVVMAGLMVALWAIVRAFARPRVYDRAMTMHPVIILIVLPIGFLIGGLAGLILAVPLTAVGLSVAQATIRILEPDTPTNLPEMVPAWLDRAAQWSWRALVAIIFVAGLVFILMAMPVVVLPVILALILAATVVPLVDALIRRGRSRGTASAIAVGGSTVAIVGVLALSMVSLVNQADEIGNTAVAGAESVDEAAGGQLGLGTDALEAGVDVGVSIITDLGAGLAAMTVVGILAVLLTFYFLRDGAGLWSSLMSHLPADASGELSDAGGRAFSVLGGYMVGTGAISLVGAASQLAIMWVLGLPLAMPVFVLSFFGGFIPYIGSLLTTGIAFLIAVAVGDTVDIVIMALWTVAFNLVQGNVVAPIVYNRTTHIHPAIVLAAIPAGSAVAGILGMFLVVPALGAVATTWRSILKVMGADEDGLPGPPGPNDEPESPESESEPGPSAEGMAIEPS